MSEVQDAMQIVMMCGKAAMVLGKITVKTALLALKIITAIYLSKWHGKVGFNRLLKIKGEQNGLTFVNVGIEPDSKENKKIFKDILKEFKAHGILYAVMPDLCAGDGATQIAISSADASKLNALLIDHKLGKHGNIQLAEITQYDYTMTGVKADGSLTQEAKSLVRDASKKMRHAMKDVPKTAGGLIRNKARQFLKKVLHKIKKVLNLENGFEVPQLYHGEVIPKKQDDQAGKSKPGNFRNKRDLQQASELHDMKAVLGDDGGYLWMRKGPLVTRDIEGEKYHLVVLKDGIHAVLIPDAYYKEPLTKAELDDPSIPCGFLVTKGMKYKTVNLLTREITEESGASIIQQELSAERKSYIGQEPEKEKKKSWEQAESPDKKAEKRTGKTKDTNMEIFSKGAEAVTFGYDRKKGGYEELNLSGCEITWPETSKECFIKAPWLKGTVVVPKKDIEIKDGKASIISYDKSAFDPATDNCYIVWEGAEGKQWRKTTKAEIVDLAKFGATDTYIASSIWMDQVHNTKKQYLENTMEKNMDKAPVIHVPDTKKNPGEKISIVTRNGKRINIKNLASDRGGNVKIIPENVQNQRKGKSR